MSTLTTHAVPLRSSSCNSQRPEHLFTCADALVRLLGLPLLRHTSPKQCYSVDVAHAGTNKLANHPCASYSSAPDTDKHSVEETHLDVKHTLALKADDVALGAGVRRRHSHSEVVEIVRAAVVAQDLGQPLLLCLAKHKAALSTAIACRYVIWLGTF